MKKYYAKVIQNATHENFAIPDIYTAVEGSFSGMDVHDFSGVVLHDETTLKIPRYYPFTELFPKVIEKYPKIDAVTGNRYVVMEFIEGSD